MLNKDSIEKDPKNASTLDLKVEAQLAKCGAALEDICIYIYIYTYIHINKS